MSDMGTQDIYEEPTGSPHGHGAVTTDRKDLLAKGGSQAARAAYGIWRARDSVHERWEAQWRVNEWRRRGIKNVRLRRDASGWFAWVPPHVENNPDALQSMNQAANQCRKFVGVMLADPPAPEATASSGTDEDQAAAEFGKRVLLDVQNDKHLNDQRLIRRAFDKASTYGSGFVWYYVDPYAGDKVPIKVSAGVDPATGRQAMTLDEAVDDPETGGAWPEYVERYVTEDNRLTNNVAEAKTDWVGALRGRVLTGRNVRMIPHDAQYITEAHGVQIGYFVTLGELKRLYPEEIEGLTDEQVDDLVSFRPARARYLLSEDEQYALDRSDGDDNERLVFCIVTYFTACAEFPDGLYLVTAGDKTVLAQESWQGEIATPDGGTQTFELPLPVTQYGQFSEGSDCPYKHGLMELLGPGNEVRSKVIADWMEHMTRANNRKIFLPMHSNVQERHLRMPGHSVVRILPGGEPKYEDVPGFSPDSYQFLSFVSGELKDVGMGDIASGLESAQVQSGRHAQAIVSQVHAVLSDVRQNIVDGYIQGCRIQLALVKAFYARERRIGFVGEDGAWKERMWTGADLRNVVDVHLANGTLTMLTPVAKAQLAEHMYTLGVIDNVKLAELTTEHMGPLLALQQDPFRDRIKRQIAYYMQGPPEGWQPNMQPQLDPATGQPVPGAPPVQAPDPVLAGIRRQLPADDLPHVALVRLRELSQAMSQSKFAVLPPEWQWGLLQEFARAQAASTPQGLQPGQQPAQAQSPAQRQATQGPMAPPATPLPNEAAGGGPPPIM